MTVRKGGLSEMYGQYLALLRYAEVFSWCPSLQIVLFPITISKMFPKEIAESLIDLIKKGIFGCGVLTCNDVFATYEELKAKGVEFVVPPTVAKTADGNFNSAFVVDPDGILVQLDELVP